MRNIIEKEIDRNIKWLSNLELLDPDYRLILNNIRDLSIILGSLDESVVPSVEPQETVVDETVAEAITEAIAAVPTTEADTDEVLTKETMRSLLAEAQAKGHMLQPIVIKYVPEGAPAKFSSIPTSRYQELAKELRELA